MMRESVEDRIPSNMYDGHINRNLRLATSMIDMSKPYIYVYKISKVETNKDQLTYEV